MNQQSASNCGSCGLTWRQPHPRTGPREQCGNCGAVRRSGKPGLAEDPQVRSIAAVTEMHLGGMLPSGMHQHLEAMGDEPLNQSSIPRWIVQCAQTARNGNPAPRARGGDDWVLISEKSNPLKADFMLDAVMDVDSQLILAVHVRDPDSLPQDVLKAAAQRAIRPPRRIITNLKKEDIQNHPLRTNMRLAQPVQHGGAADITRNTRLAEIMRVLAKRENPRGKPTREFLQALMEGMQQDLNFYRSISPQNPATPAEQAGIKPRYSSWDQVALEMMQRKNRSETPEGHGNQREQETAKAPAKGMAATADEAVTAPGIPAVGIPETGPKPAGTPAEKTPADGVPASDKPLTGAEQREGGSPGLSGNERLLREVQAFLDEVEPQREIVREALRKHEEATDAAWKLFTSLDSGKPSGPEHEGKKPEPRLLEPSPLEPRLLEPSPLEPLPPEPSPPEPSPPEPRLLEPAPANGQDPNGRSEK